MDSLAILAAAWLLQSGRSSLREAVLWFAGIEVAAGLLWLLTVVPAERRVERPVT